MACEYCFKYNVKNLKSEYVLVHEESLDDAARGIVQLRSVSPFTVMQIAMSYTRTCLYAHCRSSQVVV